ncbi:MAG: hypothetical protein K9G46_15530 [Flavobacteriales bacterium]|nr:hypothetical protein [Flavobacteriales bacterium]
MSYFKRVRPIRISRDIFIIVFVSFVLLYINDKYNQTRVYENLSMVEGGDDIQIAIKKMKRNTIWLPYIIRLAPYEDEDLIYEVEFYSKGSHLNYYSYPRILYDKKTNKVIKIDSRLRPVF